MPVRRSTVALVVFFPLVTATVHVATAPGLGPAAPTLPPAAVAPSVVTIAAPASVASRPATSQASAAPASAPAPARGAAIQMETLLQTAAAWDDSAYRTYPDGAPQVSVLRITIPPHTTMDWHRHPIPNVAYVVAGELTVERHDGAARRHFTRGQAVAELVDVSHRGVTGDQGVELVVFYAGTAGLPLSQKQSEGVGRR